MKQMKMNQSEKTLILKIKWTKTARQVEEVMNNTELEKKMEKKHLTH